MSLRRLWVSLTLVFVISFAILGYYGGEIYQTMPPIPKRVLTSTGTVLFTDKEIKDGQNVWQSMGGQEVGTIWGHGAYVAPDWNADCCIGNPCVFSTNMLRINLENPTMNWKMKEKRYCEPD